MLVTFQDTTEKQYKLCWFNPQESELHQEWPQNSECSQFLISRWTVRWTFFPKSVDGTGSVGSQTLPLSAACLTCTEKTRSSRPQKHRACFYKTSPWRKQSHCRNCSMTQEHWAELLCVLRTKLLSHSGEFKKIRTLWAQWNIIFASCSIVAGFSGYF